MFQEKSANGFSKRIRIRISSSCTTKKVEWIRIRIRILDFGLNSCAKKKVKWIRIRIKFLLLAFCTKRIQIRIRIRVLCFKKVFVEEKVQYRY